MRRQGTPVVSRGDWALGLTGNAKGAGSCGKLVSFSLSTRLAGGPHRVPALGRHHAWLGVDVCSWVFRLQAWPCAAQVRPCLAVTPCLQAGSQTCSRVNLAPLDALQAAAMAGPSKQAAGSFRTASGRFLAVGRCKPTSALPG